MASTNYWAPNCLPGYCVEVHICAIVSPMCPLENWHITYGNYSVCGALMEGPGILVQKRRRSYYTVSWARDMGVSLWWWVELLCLGCLVVPAQYFTSQETVKAACLSHTIHRDQAGKLSPFFFVFKQEAHEEAWNKVVCHPHKMVI